MCIGNTDKTLVDTTQHKEQVFRHDKHVGYIESEDHGSSQFRRCGDKGLGKNEVAFFCLGDFSAGIPGKVGTERET